VNVIWKFLNALLAFATGIEDEPETHWVERAPASTVTAVCHPGMPSWRHRQIHGGRL